MQRENVFKATMTEFPKTSFKDSLILFRDKLLQMCRCRDLMPAKLIPQLDPLINGQVEFWAPYTPLGAKDLSFKDGPCRKPNNMFAMHYGD